MIVYAERIEEATDILRGQFGVKDVEAAELLMCAAIPCPLPYPWLVLEMPFYRLVADDTWMSALASPITALPVLRTIRPRESNARVQTLLKNRAKAQVFLEPNWEMPSKPHYLFRMYPYLMQECVRIRTEYPRSGLTDSSALLHLSAAVDRVYDARWRAAGVIKLPLPPPALGYWAEILQKLSAWNRDWEILMVNLCAIAGRRAYLYNRDVDSTDWALVSRVMRDTIPVWIQEILTHFDSRGRLNSLKPVFGERMLNEQMKRLLNDGILIYQRGEWLIRDIKKVGADVLELIKGVDLS